MKQKKWFYRLLLSYFPVFFTLVSVLIVLTFLLISQLSHRETVNANRAYVNHVIQLIDHSMKEIDSMLVQEIESAALLKQFFASTQEEQQPYTIYEVSKKINQLSNYNNYIDSVYLYRTADSTVLSGNMLLPVDSFGDKGFIEQMRQAPDLYQLSKVRRYQELPGQDTGTPEVVSITRKYPLLTGGEGLVVVNISLHNLERSLVELSNSSISYLEVRDKSGSLMLSSNPNGSVPGSVLTEISSPYTGWTYRSGVHDIKIFQFFSVFSYIWAAIGIGVVVAGSAWITFITKRNYRPIESLIHRVEEYASKKNEASGKKGEDEFRFIERAIDRLIEESDTFRKMHEEDSQFRRRHFFLELLEGYRSIGQEEWEQELQRFGMKAPGGGEAMAIGLYEIDRYAEVTGKYTYRDFSLLKFVLISVIREVAEKEALPMEVWTEWTDQHRVAALYRIEGSPEACELLVAGLAEQVRAWVEHNLEFTVTAGIGTAAGELAELPPSYRTASKALSFKPALGLNRIIRQRDQAPADSGGGLPYDGKELRSFAHAYRAGEPDWRPLFSEIFREQRNKSFTREEHTRLLEAIIGQLRRELSEFPEEVQSDWREDTEPQLLAIKEQFDLAEDTEIRFLGILEAFHQRLETYRESRSHLALMKEVKAYMETEFANPDLSLTHLCDRFGLNGKYLSRLFKEAFGVKLVDFMVHVRIEESKRLLTQTSLSLQQIANAVGYIHDISYIRAFKKIEGVTPGDYRKSHTG